MTDVKAGVVPSSTESSNFYQNKSYRYYVLGILTMTYMFNFVDRQILSILQEPIKAELGLSDTQLGLLTGFAFAVFYIVMGLPIARWADQGNRRNIISFSVGLWSLMTAMCGLAQNFMQLLLARIGVGIGEAGCSPPSHSMISNIFPLKERAGALATYNSGVNIGMLAGFLLGGWIHEYFGWRVALMAVGLPGILLALVIRFTVDEPQREIIKLKADQQPETHPSLLDTIALLWSKHTFRYMVLAGSFSSFSAYSLYTWTPSFLIRSFDMGTGSVGTWLALTIGVGGAIGTFGMGYFSGWLGTKDCRWYPWSIVLAYGLPFPLVVAMLLSGDSTSSLLFFIIPAALQATYLAPLITVTHSLVKPSMRAVSSAVVLLVVNLIGLGCGPVLVGGLSDYLAADLGTDSLRYSMLFWVSLATISCVILCMLSARHIRQEMAESVN